MKNICQAEYIQSLIDNTPDGKTCLIPKGVYYIEKHINIFDRNKIIIDGSESTIIGHFNNGNSEIDTADIFHILNCINVELCNFTITTDFPVNMTGNVKIIDYDQGYYIVKVLDKYEVTGKEIFMIQNACDNERCFDDLDYYHPHPDKNKITLLANEILLAGTYVDCPKEYLGNNQYKVYLPEHLLNSIHIGQRICIRHSSYGPVAILVKNSKNTSIYNITINSFGGMGIIVLPRSENLTLDKFNMFTDDDNQLMCGNCDAIHIAGLIGTLKMFNCYFDGLGDDALNIHSIAATVTKTDYHLRKLKCNYCKKTRDGLLSPDWCTKGDIIAVLDSSTCQRKGSFKVVDFLGDTLEYKDLAGTVSEGDILQNTLFSAAVKMNNCIIKRTRARACVLQTENIEIKNCYFYGTSLPAIKAAPDVVKWYEVGPVKNMLIHNNTFEKCAFARQTLEQPVITLQDNHDNISIGAQDIHRNVKITKNRFVNKNGRCIFVTSTNNLIIKENTFINCNSYDNYKTVDCPNCRNAEVLLNRNT